MLLDGVRMIDIKIYKNGCVYWYDSNGPAIWFKDIFFNDYWGTAAFPTGWSAARPPSGNWMVLE